MPMTFKPGDKVRQKPTKPIEGEIKDAVIVEGEIRLRVDWTDKDGNAQSRFFREDEIEPVK